MLEILGNNQKHLLSILLFGRGSLDINQNIRENKVSLKFNYILPELLPRLLQASFKDEYLWIFFMSSFLWIFF